jgi:hypothetical protein
MPTIDLVKDKVGKTVGIYEHIGCGRMSTVKAGATPNRVMAIYVMKAWV